MLTRLAIVLAASLGLPQVAHADRFFFGSPETTGRMAAGEGDYIDGVLLQSENGVLQIRVIGGTIEVPESSIYKIERDMLTVKAIQSREQGMQQDLEAKNRAREEAQAAEEQAEQEAADAAAQVEQQQEPKELIINVDFQGLLPPYVFKVYDPVLHRADLTNLRNVIEEYLRDAVERAAYRRH